MPPLPSPCDLCFPDAAFLEDHFPAAPCLPGSCLLETVRRSAEAAFRRRVAALPQARFRSFVLPHVPCRLYWLPRQETDMVGWQLRRLPDKGTGEHAGRHQDAPLPQGTGPVLPVFPAAAEALTPLLADGLLLLGEALPAPRSCRY